LTSFAFYRLSQKEISHNFKEDKIFEKDLLFTKKFKILRDGKVPKNEDFWIENHHFIVDFFIFENPRLTILKK